VQRPQPHAQARRNAAAVVRAIGRDKVQLEGRACIEYQRGLVGPQVRGTHGASQPVGP
jgi:hypothetical protein